MKYLILTFLFSISAHAGFYIEKSNVGVCPMSDSYKRQGDCQEKEASPCIKLPKDYNCNYSEIVAETQMKTETEACLDADDCQAKLELKMCEEGEAIKNLDTLEVYCTWVRPEQIMVNQALKDAHDAQEASKKAMEDAMAQAKKTMACGKNVKALVMVRNAPKALTKAQIKEMVNTYKEIDSLLESGSLVTAREEIGLIVADGVLVTEEDKTALIAELDKCL